MFEKIKIDLPKIYFLILTLLVFITEPLQRGFAEKGHLGWVPSHVAAQIIKTTPENGFVGYALKFENNGTNDYYYFDRYPVFFSAITRTLLVPFENDLGFWVLMSKYWMNLIFVLTVFFSYLLTGYLTKDPFRRLSIISLAFTGYYFFQYKSMLHFDQPAILGMAALMESIFHYEKTKDSKRLIFWSIIAPLMGRGYCNLFILVFYFLFKLVKEKFSETFKLATKTIIPAIILCSSCLVYNVLMEARIRNVSLDEVSIVISAKSRLGITKFVDKGSEASIGIVTFTIEQVRRMGRHLTPYILGTSSVKYLMPLLLIIIFFLWWRKREKVSFKNDRFYLMMLFLSGPIWLFPMKRLTAPHDYTTLYYWAGSLAFFYVLTEFIPQTKKLFWITSLVFLASFTKFVIEKNKNNEAINTLAQNLNVVREEMKKHPEIGRVFTPQGHRNVLANRPYSLGFYFYDYALTDKLPRENDWMLESENGNQFKLSRYKP